MQLLIGSAITRVEMICFAGEMVYANRPHTGHTRNRSIGTHHLACTERSALPVLNAKISLKLPVAHDHDSRPSLVFIARPISGMPSMRAGDKHQTGLTLQDIEQNTGPTLQNVERSLIQTQTQVKTYSLANVTTWSTSGRMPIHSPNLWSW
jgi:hypothetical protein